MILAGVLCLAYAVGATAVYAPVRQYEGSTFFDQWAFYGNVDNTTWGNVTYLDEPNAVSKKLAFINDAGNAIVKVDNTATLTLGAPGAVVNRDSIRLTSLHSYGMGSLIVIDALHIPYGCSVWPAFWTYGIETEWPKSGEIDIIEAINNMDHNQAALHTTPGCFKGDEAKQLGKTLQDDCSTGAGCVVAESKPNSYGKGFKDAGGGVFALVMENTGFNIWFFSRPDIPENLKSATATSSIDISGWGTPSAAFPTNRCDLNKYFQPQTLVLLTTLCGVWAGVPSIYKSSCPGGTGSCFADNVLGPPSNYDNAFWEIKYIRAYLNDGAASTTSDSATTRQISTTTTTMTVTSGGEETLGSDGIWTRTSTVIAQTTLESKSGAKNGATKVTRVGIGLWVLVLVGLAVLML
ncbi:hypothetical protein D9611_013556 [Ephemerocybe angulata]|uniref:GH16 domain-containing protein n=1 Tax=Ephemerocybe angulata TaxID=980116 RepID=A0A8H5FF84_9AGAR|nr:hypothetical protein D9611_013556 [Tulosesus angulatus]